MSIALLSNVASNTTGATKKVRGPTGIIASGTFNGGTVSLQVAAKDNSYSEGNLRGDYSYAQFVEVASITAGQALVVDLVPDIVMLMRAVFTGSGANVSVHTTN